MSFTTLAISALLWLISVGPASAVMGNRFDCVRHEGRESGRCIERAVASTVREPFDAVTDGIKDRVGQASRRICGKRMIRPGKRAYETLGLLGTGKRGSSGLRESSQRTRGKGDDPSGGAATSDAPHPWRKSPDSSSAGSGPDGERDADELPTASNENVDSGTRSQSEPESPSTIEKQAPVEHDEDRHVAEFRQQINPNPRPERRAADRKAAIARVRVATVDKHQAETVEGHDRRLDAGHGRADVDVAMAEMEKLGDSIDSDSVVGHFKRTLPQDHMAARNAQAAVRSAGHRTD